MGVNKPRHTADCSLSVQHQTSRQLIHARGNTLIIIIIIKLQTCSSVWTESVLNPSRTLWTSTLFISTSFLKRTRSVLMLRLTRPHLVNHTPTRPDTSSRARLFKGFQEVNLLLAGSVCRTHTHTHTPRPAAYCQIKRAGTYFEVKARRRSGGFVSSKPRVYSSPPLPSLHKDDVKTV